MCSWNSRLALKTRRGAPAPRKAWRVGLPTALSIRSAIASDGMLSECIGGSGDFPFRSRRVSQTGRKGPVTITGHGEKTTLMECLWSRSEAVRSDGARRHRRGQLWRCWHSRRVHIWVTGCGLVQLRMFQHWLSKQTLCRCDCEPLEPKAVLHGPLLRYWGRSRAAIRSSRRRRPLGAQTGRVRWTPREARVKSGRSDRRIPEIEKVLLEQCRSGRCRHGRN
jgi:hypothetical protein